MNLKKILIGGGGGGGGGGGAQVREVNLPKKDLQPQE